MLDDLTVMHHRDTQDLLGAVERQSQQLVDSSLSFEAVDSMLDVVSDVKNVVFAGMGGSALAGAIVQSWAEPKVPFNVVRDYDAPAFISSDTLCILVSYSGGTEETVSFFEQALAKGARIVVISHGGRLEELAKGAGMPFIRIPATTQPRFATFYIVKAAALVLERSNLIGRAAAELEATNDWLIEVTKHWRPDVATVHNEAKRLALELVGKTVVIGSGPKLSAAAKSWKLAINENAKQVAWTSEYPEANHNEFIGWTRQPIQKPYAVVELRSGLEHPQVQKRFEVSERLLSGMRPAPIVASVEGETLVQQLLYSVVLGNYVSIYLALLNNIDPSAAQIVDKLKKELS